MRSFEIEVIFVKHLFQLDLYFGFVEYHGPFSLGSFVGATARCHQWTSMLDFLCLPSTWQKQMSYICASVLE